MGGIGKTTIAQFIFNKYSSEYEGCCFLKNVGEESERHGLDYLCEQLVSQLLKKQNIPVRGSANPISVCDHKSLSGKKFFIVLDDVDASRKLEYLGEQLTLGAGSRVIVTTADKQIFKKVHGIYEVRPLNFSSSLQLFCLNAFGHASPKIGYQELSKMVVNYAKGIPLALEVLGSFLRSRKSIRVRESALEKLRVHPNKVVYNVLKLSVDELDYHEKIIFLDIVFFFKGKNKDEVSCFLESCKLFGSIGIDSLQDKALITISPLNKIEMHDLIEQTGLEIVFNESPNDLKKRSRLRNPENVRNVLEDSEGEKSVEGILYNLSESGDLHLSANTFKNMPHLRFLRFYGAWHGRKSNVYVETTLEPFSAKLRYLEWCDYPLNSLPSRFCAEVTVKFRNSGMESREALDSQLGLCNHEFLDVKQ
ncbi:TMV resistance protein N-like [Arachis ipaensis]|nr:TMV resistance protein N-like [Arachis ipaensis]